MKRHRDYTSQYYANVLVAVLATTGANAPPAQLPRASQTPPDERRSPAVVTPIQTPVPSSNATHSEAYSEISQFRLKLIKFWRAYRAMHSVF